MIPQDMTPAEMAPEESFSAAQMPADMIAALYAHPGIAERIVQTWGDPLCVQYMQDVMLPAYYDEREVLHDHECRAIIKLIELHDGLHPRKSDVWGIAA